MADAPQDEPYSGDEPPNEAFDWEEFGHHLEDSVLSDEQKQDFIETLYGVMLSMVDLGIDLRSVGCGQNAESGIFSPADLLFSEHTDNQSDEAAHDALRQLAGKEES